MKSVLPDGSPLQRALRAVTLALKGPQGTRDLIQTRCERGADIVRRLGFPAATSKAIFSLDEHWNGRGQPRGLKGWEIPLPARILGLSQTVEVFLATYGATAALEMTQERSGKWLDPQLVRALMGLRDDTDFCRLATTACRPNDICHLEPAEASIVADENKLDQIAEAFSQVIDAKSPWTHLHSEGVAELADGMAQVLGMSSEDRRGLRRAGLLHDIGKLGVSNLILDEPSKLDDDERAALRKHPEYSQQILDRVPALRDIAVLAGGHHERIDGRGYHQGLPGELLPMQTRLLTVADICEAMSAKRPYRDRVPLEDVMSTMQRDTGSAICHECFEALQVHQQRSSVLQRIESRVGELEMFFDRL